MRSAWMAGFLSPIVVGVAIYLIGILFGVDRDLVRYFTAETPKTPLLSIAPVTTKARPAEKPYNERLSNPNID